MQGHRRVAFWPNGDPTIRRARVNDAQAPPDPRSRTRLPNQCRTCSQCRSRRCSKRAAALLDEGRTVNHAPSPRRRCLPGCPAGAPGRRWRNGTNPAARRHDHRRAVGDACRRVEPVGVGNARADRPRQRSAARDHRRGGGGRHDRHRRAAAVGDTRKGPQHRRVAACPAGSAARPTSGTGSVDWTPRSAPNPNSLSWAVVFGSSLDDGRGDVSRPGADAGAHWCDDGCALLLAGRDTGVRVPVSDVASALVGYRDWLPGNPWKRLGA